MTDSSEEYKLVKLLIEELQKNESKAENSITTVTTLWTVLFGLILLQKLWRYIGKPMYKNYSRRNTPNNSDSDIAAHQ